MSAATDEENLKTEDAGTSRDSARSAAVQLTALGFGHAVIDSYGHTLLAPMFPLLAERLEFGKTGAGALPLMMGLTASLAQPFVGWVTDRWPRIPAVALGPALTATFIGLVGFAPNYTALAAILFCAGVGIGAYHPQAASLAHRASRGSGLAMSSFTVGGNIGFGVAPILGVLYFHWFGFERFYFACLPGLVFGAMLLMVFRSPRHDLLRHRAESSAATSRRNQPIALALLTGTVTVRAAVQIAMSTFLAFLLRERPPAGNVDPTNLAGAALSVFLLASAVAGPIGGHLSDRCGRKPVMLFSLAAAPIIFTIALALPGYWMITGLAVGGFVLMLPHPANVAMAQEYMPSSAGVAASMITGVAWGLGQFLSWPLGAIAERTSVTFALELIVWLPLAGVLMVLPLREPERAAGNLE